jgi:glycerol-1-phosphate dehydrogenase [NAD(P)+]
LGGGRYTVCVNDPPWSSLAALVPAPARVVPAGDMDLGHLDRVAGVADDGEVVVGLGGGTALDTAKHLAWRTGRPLVQIPGITSVDAAFTDAIGVRVDGHVRYIGTVVPERVVLDLDLVRAAPPRLNRAGIGDVLSCHTGLRDWRLAADAGVGAPWDERLAALGAMLLDELGDHIDEIAATTPTGIRFLADAYRRIGAACAFAGHSRFEEGSEHFLAYALEHHLRRTFVHGEVIAFGVLVMAAVQGNSPERAVEIVERSGVRAHPADLGIDRTSFDEVTATLASFVLRLGLDASVIDLGDPSSTDWAHGWCVAESVPRRT